MTRLHYYLLAIMPILHISGCEKSENTQTEHTIDTTQSVKISLVSGDNQSGTYGEDLTNELIFKIIVPQDKHAELYYVTFAQVQGNGIIGNGPTTEIGVLPDGTAKIKWQLGCDTPNQKIKAYVYSYRSSFPDYEGPHVPEDSIEIKATGTKATGWARACGCGNTSTYNVKLTTFDNKTLFLVNQELYASTDGGINWDQVNGIPKSSEVVSAQFNSKGWMYLLTKSDGILYSKDLKSWIAINNGIDNKIEPTGFLIKDDVMMVGFYFDGLYITTDNGGSWQKSIVPTSSQRFRFFNKHPDGSLYLFDSWGTLFRSKDTGKTWQSIQLDYGYYLSDPSTFGIGPDGNLYIGSDEAIIAQISPITLKGTAKRYYEANGYSQYVNNISFFKGDVFYLVNSTPKPGIYSVKNNWGKLELNFTKVIYSYYIKPDGNFLLGTLDGLYYRN